jgi:hypothetical protein
METNFAKVNPYPTCQNITAPSDPPDTNNPSCIGCQSMARSTNKEHFPVNYFL